MRAGALIAAVVLVGMSGPAASVQPVTLVAQGGERLVDEAALRALPPTGADVIFITRDGPERGDYLGPLLWRVVDGPSLSGAGKLMRTIVVTGRDGYAVVLSLSEIDPEYGNEPALLALTRDGASLPAAEGPRLVFPGDKRGSRAIYDVVRIEVR